MRHSHVALPLLLLLPRLRGRIDEGARRPSVILVPDTGIHAPSSPPFGLLPSGGGLRWGGATRSRLRKWRGRRVHGAMGAPRTVISVRRHGNPCPLLSGCARAPGATSAPPTNAPIPLPCLLKPVLSRSKGIPETPGAGALACQPRFTSKCRKMSQNVALFRPSTRKPLQFTSEKPHDLGPFPAILAHFRSFPSS